MRTMGPESGAKSGSGIRPLFWARSCVEGPRGLGARRRGRPGAAGPRQRVPTATAVAPWCAWSGRGTKRAPGLPMRLRGPPPSQAQARKRSCQMTQLMPVIGVRSMSPNRRGSIPFCTGTFECHGMQLASKERPARDLHASRYPENPVSVLHKGGADAKRRHSLVDTVVGGRACATGARKEGVAVAVRATKVRRCILHADRPGCMCLSGIRRSQQECVWNHMESLGQSRAPFLGACPD